MLPPESVMLEHYGVGRASLREALRILEVQGFIVLKPGPGGGPMVAGAGSKHFGKMTTLYLHLSGATFGDVLAARMVLEPVMVRLAAEHPEPENVERLDAYVHDPQPSPHLLPTQHLQTSTEFHGMVSSMSSNPVLDLFANAIRDIYVARQHGLTYPEQERSRVVRDHVEIAEKIRDGEADEAERLMREHMIEFAGYSAERFPGMLDEVVDWY
jgi:DNA-binding FadR family transcriptional regulator